MDKEDTNQESVPVQATKVIDEMTGVLRDQAETFVPNDVRVKLAVPFKERLIALSVYLLLGTLLGWSKGGSLFGWWIGGLLGFHLLDVDHLLDVFILHPEKQDSQQVKEALKTQNWKQAWKILIKTAPGRTRLVLHSVVFEVVVLFLVIYVVTSKGGLFAAGLVLAFWLRILYEQVREFMKTGKMERWFWQVKEEVPSNLQAVFLTVGIVVWVIMSVAAF